MQTVALSNPSFSIRKALAIAFAAIALLSQPAANAGAVAFAFLEFDTELTSLTLSGGPFLMPLASDPGNALGDSIEGYGFVQSLVTVSLSSAHGGSPSLGKAFANNFPPAASGGVANGAPPPQPIDPNALDGQPFFVSSFFDVFFDITLTDVDLRPGRDFAGQIPGATLLLPDNGPARMQNNYEAIFDKDAPNFGLIPPPEAAPYLGHFSIEIPLGGDINGNGENDKIKFTLATHSAGDENRTFIVLPDGTVIDQFDSTAAIDGLVVDESTDPPFSIGMVDLETGVPDDSFGGPTTAQSNLVNEVIPEPASAILAILGGAAMLARRRRH